MTQHQNEEILGLEGNPHMRVQKVNKPLGRGWKYDIIKIQHINAQVHTYKLACTHKHNHHEAIYFTWFAKRTSKYNII